MIKISDLPNFNSFLSSDLDFSFLDDVNLHQDFDDLDLVDELVESTKLSINEIENIITTDDLGTEVSNYLSLSVDNKYLG